ncbi:MAG: ABC transporter ATP-binding protein [Verrucomicrobiales bacterium]|nr:ABC transporter ATP-binding protein [Verrucomicrobiales bacterium]
MKEDGDAAIEVRGLTKRFGDKTVVDDVSLRVPRGSVFGFLGPNGSGKTTCLRMICGLLEPTAGDGTCLGFDILSQRREIKREVGYMTQKFSLYEDLTVAENLAFVARVYEMPDARHLLQQTLERFDLAGRQRQLAGSLSGGWKQRLSLAACMLHQPRLLLLDEPTAGVDPKARRDFWEEIHQLAAEGLTVLVTTHYMDEAERCTHLAYLAYGKLLVQGDPTSLVQQSGLTTFNVTARESADLAVRLRALPGVDLVAAFGKGLHVCGRDAVALRAALDAVAHEGEVEVRPGRTSLEDVFIYLMGQTPDNFANPSSASIEKGGAS